jgi:hypothetical protein
MVARPQYILQDRADGSVELIQIVPTVIATFPDRAKAEQIYRVLVEHGDAAPVPKPVTERRPAAALIPAPAAPATKATVPATVPAGPPAKAQVAQDPDADPAEEDWQQAFEAMVAGGDLKTQAEALGVGVYKFRGRYAAWCGRRKRAAEADRPADPDRDTCRICARAFKPSAASPDLCARCARD